MPTQVDSNKARQQLVRAAAKRFERQGYDVQADHIDHPNGPPESINGHRPDLLARKTNFEIAAKVVLDGELPEASNDWQALSEAASESSQRQFMVVVPESELAEAQQQADSLGVTVNHFLTDATLKTR